MINTKNLSSAFFVLTMRKLIVYDKLNKKLVSENLHKEKELLSTISKMNYSYFLSKYEEETSRISNITDIKKILEDKDTLNVIRKQIFV